MKIYSCKTCEKNFLKKSAYDSHLSRLNPCVKINKNICIKCDKSYSTKSNLNKHLKNCKEILLNNNIEDDNQSQINEIKQELENKFEEQVEQLKIMFQKKFEEQQKQIKELSQITETNNQMTEGRLPSGNITVTENSHNNTTTNNIINIYNAGKEDLSRLSKEDAIKICTSGTYYPIVAAELIHCNKNYPEFQNFLIPNLRSNTGLVKINDNWESRTHEEIFRTLLKVDKNHVSTLMKDLEVDKKLQVKLESTKDEIDTGESKEHQIPKIKEKLYNASKMVTKNKKKEEKVL
jgi:hypothetical protein